MSRKKSFLQKMIITKTPCRISFFGGGTDFESYFNKNAGLVIGAAVNKYIYVVLNTLERLLDKKIRMSASSLEIVDSAEELKHDITRCVLSEVNLNDHFLDLHTFADLPGATGIGSSSAYAVGLINAISLLKGEHKTPHFLAKEAIVVERKKLKHNGGWQDQIFSAFGGFSRVYFTHSSFSVEPLCLHRDRISMLENSCLLVFTGLTRSSQVVQKKLDNLESRKKEDLISKIHLYANEANNLLIKRMKSKDFIAKFGELLHENWLAKKALGKQISNPLIDEMYDKGMKAGAYGGKLCGAGNGGFLLFIVPKTHRAKVIHALHGFRHMSIQFDHGGSRPIYSYQF